MMSGVDCQQVTCWGQAWLSGWLFSVVQPDVSRSVPSLGSVISTSRIGASGGDSSSEVESVFDGICKYELQMNLQ